MNLETTIPHRDFFKANPAFLVGGSIRDMLLGRVPEDFDIVPTTDARQFAQALQQETGGSLVELGTPRQRLHRIVSKQRVYDITPMNGPDIAADLERRDFTINALALRLDTGNLIDICGGLADLNAGYIRSVSAKAFQQDPVRLIRAYRLSAVLGFMPTSDTLSRIRADSARIRTAAGERIRSELLKLLTTDAAHAFVRQMATTGLLSAALDLPPQTSGGKALERLEILRVFESLRQKPSENGTSLDMMERDQLPIVKLALILMTLVSTRDFPSVERVVPVLDRLRLSNKERDTVRAIARHTPTTVDLLAASSKTGIERRIAFRVFSACKGEFPAVLLASLSILLRREPISERADLMAAASDLGSLHADAFLPFTDTPPFLDGRDMMRCLNLPPGPHLGNLLNRITEEKFVRPDLTRREALALARRLLDNTESRT